MRLPTKVVKIGGFDLNIEAIDRDTADAQGIMGDCSWADLRIRYCTGYPEGVQVGVLAHEIVHGIVNDRGLATQGSTRDERITDGFTNGLVSFIRDNPKLALYLVKKIIDTTHEEPTET